MTEQPLLTIGQPPRDPFYRYTWQGRDLPSWSSLRAMAGLRPQIHAWALGGMADKAVELAATLGAAAVTGDQAALAWARDRLWDAAASAQRAPADRGTAIHEATHLGELPADEDLASSVRQYRAWLADTGAEIVASEFTVWNLTAGYAGTADRLVLFPDGSIWLADLKTGRSLWGEHALQLMAYAMAEFASSQPDVVDERLTALHHAAKGMAILHLRPDGWEWRAIRPDPAMWRAFRGLLAFADWIHEYDDIDKVTTAIARGAT